MTDRIEHITEAETKELIGYYRDDYSELGRAKYAHYRLLLRYKRKEKEVQLKNLIKKKLGVSTLGGNFTPQEISKVLGVSVTNVKKIESKVIRVLKSPYKSKDLKIYLNQGE